VLDIENMTERDRYVALGLYVWMFLSLAIAAMIWAFFAGASSAKRSPGCDDACRPAHGAIKDGHCYCRIDFSVAEESAP